MKKIDFSHLRNEKYCVHVVTDTLPERYNVMLRETDSDRRRISEIARRHGVNPESAHYFPQLARFPGDPEAFVTSRSEIRSLLERRGWSASGIVDFESRIEKKKSEYEVSDDLVDRYFSEQYTPEEIAEMKPEDVAEKKDALRKKLSGASDVSDVQ